MTIVTKVRMAGLIAVLGACLAGSASAAQPSGEKPKAPALNLTNPAGATVPLSTYLGKKPVLLVFWASWCTICNEEIPLLKKLNAGRFQVLAVNEGESAWKTKRFVAANDINYPVALDQDGSVAKAFQVPGVPACAVLDRAGHIVYRGIGLPERIDAYAAQ